MKTVVESLSAPPLFYRISDIEKGFINVFALGDNLNMMSPWHKGEWQWESLSISHYIWSLLNFCTKLVQFYSNLIITFFISKRIAIINYTSVSRKAMYIGNVSRDSFLPTL